MLGKAYMVMAVGIAALFVGVVYSIVASTGNMIETQTELLDARVHGKIGDAEYAQSAKEAEHTYRNKIADALERLESKFYEAADFLTTIDSDLNETNATNMTEIGNYSSDLAIVAGNLSEGIDRFRTESIS